MSQTNPLLTRISCTVKSCISTFSNIGARTQHFNRMHRKKPNTIPPLQEQENRSRHDSLSPASGDLPLPTTLDDVPMDGDEDIRSGDSSMQADDRSAHVAHASFHGVRCSTTGVDLSEEEIARGPVSPSQPDYKPFNDRTHFEITDFLYRRVRMPAGRVNELMTLWAAHAVMTGGSPPFLNSDDLHATIDAISHGDAPWKSFAISYNGNDIDPQGTSASWKYQEYEVWFRDPLAVIRNMLSNPDFDGEFDYAPFRQFNRHGEREFKDFMSGDWCWAEANKILRAHPTTRGNLLVPIILGSDKTTVSVATGQNDYYPLYLSIGNIHNNVRRAHRESVIPIGFLAIPKSERKHDSDRQFLRFRRQLFHTTLQAILESLRPYMEETPDITLCPDGFYRRVTYSIGPYIADYPEQALLACVVQGWCTKCTAWVDDLDNDKDAFLRTHEWTQTMIDGFEAQEVWDAYGIIPDVTPFTQSFPRANIHELLAPDLLHQIIKGTFKDHLISWIGDYLVKEYGEAMANTIWDDIDRRISVVPPFPGLRRFPDGRRFKQWTGDDSKALMKVILPALVSKVPDDFIHCMAAFLDFCYLVRRSVITETDLNTLDETLARFHHYREAFRKEGFGAPNGLCSSITEAKHIKAVKEPWRRSNKYNALGQMLLTNQRISKLGALHAYLKAKGLLEGTIADHLHMLLQQLQDSVEEMDGDLSATEDEDEEGEEDDSELADEAVEDDDGGPVPGVDILGEVVLARTPERISIPNIKTLADQLNQAHFDLVYLVTTFLEEQLEARHRHPPPVDLLKCKKIRRFKSAIATFCAPSDPSGLGGLKTERIRATSSWRGQGPRYDTVYAVVNEGLEGMRALAVLRVKAFFSFDYDDQYYPCALVEWFSVVGDRPDPLTGLWIVEPDVNRRGDRDTTVVHIDTIWRLAHLIPVYSHSCIPFELHFSDTLDVFHLFYSNKYVDHHANEIAY
ncbi:hypothetical protein CC2G_009715 [Coprinopsis cinerea AmutBmut pab1-1]|nr:hypothetical protein CC2G_009715 [Coprinopsis cinerea AmutBmut pab1-1]